MISPYSVPCPLEEYLPPSGRKRKQSAELAMEAQAEAEQSGISLGSLLYSSQPGEKDSCSQDECNPLKKGTSKKLSCRKVIRGGRFTPAPTSLVVKDDKAHTIM